MSLSKKNFNPTLFLFNSESATAELTYASFMLGMGCSDTKGAGANPPDGYVEPAHRQTGLPPVDDSWANVYSWDGSWSPSSAKFPLKGMFDETHAMLPPGKWGWDGACDCPGDEGLAVYNNEFVAKGLDFEALVDDASHQFGWRLIGTNDAPMTLDHRGDNYVGTPWVDIIDLGGVGELASTGPGDTSPGMNLCDGPDMLRYGIGRSVDMRTGSDTRGALFDNDLVILGTERIPVLNEYDVEGTTIHTGPGSDLVFARNFGPAAIDLGNGLSGRTDTTDTADGDDIEVLQGNMRDFRVYGGYGNDIIVWYVDEVNDDRWLGPNFFGGGGFGDAIWEYPGSDRLILAVDLATQVVSSRSEHDNNPGSFLAFIYSDYAAAVDAPMAGEPYAQYYGTAPVGPDGEHTLTLSYRSADGTVFTHDFYATGIEIIQLGIDDDAAVYEVDQVAGALQRSNTIPPFTAIPNRDAFNRLFDRFARPITLP
ncbi:MAG: hypothetical protein JXR76_15050 [Deltaproteobacteria bacterium]|nr:hypothetical protein [Deltaproteobacteria bacterium]